MSNGEKRDTLYIEEREKILYNTRSSFQKMHKKKSTRDFGYSLKPILFEAFEAVEFLAPVWAAQAFHFCFRTARVYELVVPDVDPNV